MMTFPNPCESSSARKKKHFTTFKTQGLYLHNITNSSFQWSIKQSPSITLPSWDTQPRRGQEPKSSEHIRRHHLKWLDFAKLKIEVVLIKEYRKWPAANISTWTITRKDPHFCFSWIAVYTMSPEANISENWPNHLLYEWLWWSQWLAVGSCQSTWTPHWWFGSRCFSLTYQKTSKP